LLHKSSESCKRAVVACRNLIDIAREYGRDMEATCCCSATCSTCQAIAIDDTMYGRIPRLQDYKSHMLDLALALQKTLSWLMCAVHISKETDRVAIELLSMK
ncbi:hypothetical protein C7212DRAFT_162563, partial [Tuber magnatum]